MVLFGIINRTCGMTAGGRHCRQRPADRQKCGTERRSVQLLSDMQNPVFRVSRSAVQTEFRSCTEVRIPEPLRSAAKALQCCGERHLLGKCKVEGDDRHRRCLRHKCGQRGFGKRRIGTKDSRTVIEGNASLITVLEQHFKHRCAEIQRQTRTVTAHGQVFGFHGAERVVGAAGIVPQIGFVDVDMQTVCLGIKQTAEVAVADGKTVQRIVRRCAEHHIVMGKDRGKIGIRVPGCRIKGQLHTDNITPSKARMHSTVKMR